MRNFVLKGCSFKPVELKKHKTPVKYKPSHKTKVYCVCIEETPNNFKAYINVKSNLEFPDTISIPFTERSYDLKGKTKVFTITKDKKGKSICILRNQLNANNFPGFSTYYTPFKHKYVYSGYITRVNGENQFDVIEVFDNLKYCKDLVENIRIKDTNYE